MPFPTAMKPSGAISSSAPPSFRAKKKKPGAVDAKGRAETAGEVDPKPQNSGRMTGPPMQMGPGQGSMFANGRTGVPQGNTPRTPNYPQAGPGPTRVAGQPQYAPPATPNYPQGGPGPRGVRGQAQGGMPSTPNYPAHMANGRPRMMDDGGMMGNPAPIGGMPDDDQGNEGPVPGDGSDPTQGTGGPGGPPPMGGVIIKPEAVGYHDEPRACAGANGGPACSYFGQDGMCAVLQMQVSGPGGCDAYEAVSGGEPDQGMPPGGSGAQNDDGTSGNPSLS
jgi:hypothetical protein